MVTKNAGTYFASYNAPTPFVTKGSVCASRVIWLEIIERKLKFTHFPLHTNRDT